MDKIPWWEMEPAKFDDVFRKREDEWRVCRIDTVSDFIPSAFSREHNIAVAYIFDQREFFLNSYWKSNEFLYFWFDPVSGQYFPASETAAGGYRKLGQNAGGGHDWLFIASKSDITL